MTIRGAKIFGQSELEESSPTPSLDVNCLLENILQCDKTFLFLHANDTLSPKQESNFIATIEKRKTGLPIAYITNHKEFYGFDFYVTPDVLIPKPDTEILVENAVDEILYRQNGNDCHVERSRNISSSDRQTEEDYDSSLYRQTGGDSTSSLDRELGGDRLKICDMCAGSGCIGIAVYLTLKDKVPAEKLPEITFVDISDAALEIAKLNVKRLIETVVSTPNKEENINNLYSSQNTEFGDDSHFHFIQSNLFENVSDTFDFILTNPPYIPSKMVDELLLDGRNEPRIALDGDIDGLGLIRRLIPQMKNHLAPNGTFFMETGEYNAEEAARICEENGFKDVKIIRDLEGQLRVVTGEKI